jgi:hypothetical protein
MLDFVEIETVELIVQQLHDVALPINIIHAEVDAPFGAVLDQLEKRMVFPGPVAQLRKRPAYISFPLKQRGMVQYGPGGFFLLKKPFLFQGPFVAVGDSQLLVSLCIENFEVGQPVSVLVE